MRKKIFLTENELVSLIRSTIMEQHNDEELIKQILNYTGCDENCLEIKSKLISKNPLTLVDTGHFEAHCLKIGNTTSKDLILDLGKKTYEKVVKGNLSPLISQILIDNKSNFQIKKPNKIWFQNSINDLEYIKKIFTPEELNKKHKFSDDNFQKSFTLEEKINNLISSCANETITGIMETIENAEMWSILNKVDTNLINWENLIRKNYNLRGDSYCDKIYDYFKQKNFNLSSEKIIGKSAQKIGFNLKTLSFAELDLIKILLNYKNFFEDNVKKILQNTSEKGDMAERDFEYLYNNTIRNEYFSIDRKFSFPGNLVDIVLGIDYVIEKNGIKYIIQVKTSKPDGNVAIFKYSKNSMCVYPKDVKGLRFNYDTLNNKNLNFDSDFLKMKEKDKF